MDNKSVYTYNNARRFGFENDGKVRAHSRRGHRTENNALSLHYPYVSTAIVTMCKGQVVSSEHDVELVEL